MSLASRSSPMAGERAEPPTATTVFVFERCRSPYAAAAHLRRSVNVRVAVGGARGSLADPVHEARDEHQRHRTRQGGNRGFDAAASA